MVEVGDGSGVQVVVGDGVVLGTSDAVSVGGGAMTGRAAKPMPERSNDAMHRPIAKPNAKYLVDGLTFTRREGGDAFIAYGSDLAWVNFIPFFGAFLHLTEN